MKLADMKPVLIRDLWEENSNAAVQLDLGGASDAQLAVYWRAAADYRLKLVGDVKASRDKLRAELTAQLNAEKERAAEAARAAAVEAKRAKEAGEAAARVIEKLTGEKTRLGGELGSLNRRVADLATENQRLTKDCERLARERDALQPEAVAKRKALQAARARAVAKFEKFRRQLPAAERAALGVK